MKRHCLLLLAAVVMLATGRIAFAQSTTPTRQEQLAKAEALVKDLEQQTNAAELDYKRVRDQQANGGATAEQVAAALAKLQGLVAKVKDAKQALAALQNATPATPTTPTGDSSSVATAEALVKDLVQQVNKAEDELKRQRDLKASGTATDADVAAAETKLKELLAKLTDARKALDAAKSAAGSTTISATTRPTDSTTTAGSRQEQLAKAEALVVDLNKQTNDAELEFKRLRDSGANADQLAAAKTKLTDLVAKLKAAKAALEQLRSGTSTSTTPTTPAASTTSTRQQQIAAAEARVVELRQAENLAERQFKEVRDLNVAGKATQAQLDAARAKLTDLGAKLKAAQRELEQLRAAG